VREISASLRSSTSDAIAAANSVSSPPSITSTGSARGARRSAPGAQTSANGAAAGTHTRARPVFASCRCSSSAYSGAWASSALVNALRDGPPSAILVSGRLESTARLP